MILLSTQTWILDCAVLVAPGFGQLALPSILSPLCHASEMDPSHVSGQFFFPSPRVVSASTHCLSFSTLFPKFVIEILDLFAAVNGLWAAGFIATTRNTFSIVDDARLYVSYYQLPTQRTETVDNALYQFYIRVRGTLQIFPNRHAPAHTPPRLVKNRTNCPTPAQPKLSTQTYSVSRGFFPFCASFSPFGFFLLTDFFFRFSECLQCWFNRKPLLPS